MVCMDQSSYKPYGFIYVIENDVNDKKYVGKTIDPDNRKCKHFGMKSECPFLIKALRKYGSEHFDFVLLEACSSDKELGEREKYWIKHLHTLAPAGYNLTEGGTGGRLSPDVEHSRREKLSGKDRPNSLAKIGRKNPMFGRTHTRKTRIKMREDRLAEQNQFFGKKHSEESKRRMSEARKLWWGKKKTQSSE